MQKATPGIPWRLVSLISGNRSSRGGKGDSGRVVLVHFQRTGQTPAGSHSDTQFRHPCSYLLIQCLFHTGFQGCLLVEIMQLAQGFLFDLPYALLGKIEFFADCFSYEPQRVS